MTGISLSVRKDLLHFSSKSFNLLILSCFSPRPQQQTDHTSLQATSQNLWISNLWSWTCPVLKTACLNWAGGAYSSLLWYWSMDRLMFKTVLNIFTGTISSPVAFVCIFYPFLEYCTVVEWDYPNCRRLQSALVAIMHVSQSKRSSKKPSSPFLISQQLVYIGH